MSNYKVCSNGHYYDSSLAACPYCASSGQETNAGGTVGYEQNVKINVPIKGDETEPIEEGNLIGGTIELDNNHPKQETEGLNDNKPLISPSDNSDDSRTIMYEEKKLIVDGKEEIIVVQRSARRLVGWLVSYTLDPMGVDFRLYEGKNSIGSSANNQITLYDNTVSSRHAVIRYLKGKFAIKDEMSSHGTIVNDNDIELDAVYLNDGDVIKLGQTVLKFRSAL